MVQESKVKISYWHYMSGLVVQPFPATKGREAGYSVDESPFDHRANTETNETNNHAHSQTLLRSI